MIGLVFFLHLVVSDDAHLRWSRFKSEILDTDKVLLLSEIMTCSSFIDKFGWQNLPSYKLKKKRKTATNV